LKCKNKNHNDDADFLFLQEAIHKQVLLSPTHPSIHPVTHPPTLYFFILYKIGRFLCIFIVGLVGFQG
jgi:hypothetical protein